MYALTIKQPWVDLILSGEKRYEFRRWAPRKVCVGDRLALHEAVRGVVAVARYGGAYGGGNIVRRMRNGFVQSCPGYPGLEEWLYVNKRPWRSLRLDNVTPIECVECPGKQGLWMLPPEIEAAVKEQLA